MEFAFEDAQKRTALKVLLSAVFFNSIALCVFGRRGPKMFNFELLFLHGISLKIHEILHQAVLTPQECEDYFFEKIRKNGEKIFKKIVGRVSTS